MKHKISGRKLNRKTSHRISLLKNLSKSLIRNEQIETTLPKAKDLRPFVEKIIHKGKIDNLHSRRKVYDFIRDTSLVNKIFGVLAKRYNKRNGGYVRILKSGFRYGDSAPKAVIELVDRDENAKGLNDKLRLKAKEDSKEKNQDLDQHKDSLNKKKETKKIEEKKLESTVGESNKTEKKNIAKEADIKKEKK
jgi:large subunit ribosomal protein L17